MYFHVYLIYRFMRTFTDHSSVITRCWGFELQNGKSSLKSPQTLATQDFAPASFLSTPDRLLAGDARSFSMYKSDDKRYATSMKNAEASVRMEGCQVTPQMREQCQRVLRGEMTTAELLRRGAQGSSAERTN